MNRKTKQTLDRRTFLRKSGQVAAADPDHSYNGGRTVDNGAMDGFLKTSGDVYPAGHYVEQDFVFLSQFRTQIYRLRPVFSIDTRTDVFQPDFPALRPDGSPG